MKKSTLVFFGPTFVACVLALAGCAGTSMNWPTTAPDAPMTAKSGEPIPRVQDCTTIDVGSPTKYVCHGKEYSSHELQKMRETGTMPTKG
jgi:hypothetical protein